MAQQNKYTSTPVGPGTGTAHKSLHFPAGRDLSRQNKTASLNHPDAESLPENRRRLQAATATHHKPPSNTAVKVKLENDENDPPLLRLPFAGGRGRYRRVDIHEDWLPFQWLRYAFPRLFSSPVDLIIRSLLAARACRPHSPSSKRQQRIQQWHMRVESGILLYELGSVEESRWKELLESCGVNARSAKEMVPDDDEYNANLSFTDSNRVFLISYLIFQAP
ncbi:hypothetical protein D9613_011507 [Agrocybe pediades]|uniref:Uncharacterized protein n=1 Tax=Agrocybe pediades TaxID=84607 RepID=A0A8H4VS33_9AGAR|nr:hypothetical protein D9613_011507 [Agrocybe pediades]